MSEEQNPEKQIIDRKAYTIEVVMFEDGIQGFRTENDGFKDRLQLLGALTRAIYALNDKIDKNDIVIGTDPS